MSGLPQRSGPQIELTAGMVVRFARRHDGVAIAAERLAPRLVLTDEVIRRVNEGGTAINEWNGSQWDILSMPTRAPKPFNGGKST